MSSSKESPLEENFTQDLGFLKEVLGEVENEESQNHEIYLKILNLLPKNSKNYSQSSTIGSGGMKTIQQAWDPSTDREIAIASIKEQKEDVLQTILFINEAWISSRLEHPNIVPIYEVALNEENNPFFTMKLLKGVTLQEWLKNESEKTTRPSIIQRLDIFKKICDAIAYAHSMGIAHLDLKPSNILVGEFGEIQVIDWGLAQAYNTDKLSSQQQEINRALKSFFENKLIGTPDYMAPEIIEGLAPNASADTYSLGVILRCLLSFSMPGISAYESMQNVPRSLRFSIEKCTHQDPKKRYASIDELSHDIDAYMDGFATSAESPKLMTHLVFFMKRHKQTCLLLATSFFIITILIAYSFSKIKASEAIALDEARKSSTALKNLQKETAAKKQLTKILAPQVVLEQRKEVQSLNFQQALISMEFLVNLDAEDPEILFRYARLKMAMFDFKKAKEVFIQIKEANPDYPDINFFIQTSTDYCNRIDERSLNDSDYLELIPKIRQGTVALAVFETLYKQKSLQEQAEFYRAYLKQEFDFTILPDQTLKIKTIVLPTKAFFDLPVKILEIGTIKKADKTFTHLKELQELKISNTLVKNIGNLPSLTKLELENSTLGTNNNFSHSHFPKLKFLSLRNSTKETWPRFRNHDNLEYLDLRGTNFSKFGELAKLAQLKTLKISTPLTEEQAQTFIKNKPDLTLIIED